MIRPIALSAAFLAALSVAAPALAQEPDPGPPILTVTGTGEVSVAPDMATLRIGVETQDETAAAALAANNQAAQQVMDTLKERGVAERDVQTANFSVHPVYEDMNRIEPRPEGPRVIGYRVTNQVVARVRDLDDLGTLLDASVSGGANRIDGLEFGLEDDAAPLDEARAEAVRDARRKAGIYAEAAGVSLGPIRSIGEFAIGPVPMRDMAMRAEAAMTVPIAPGEMRVTATVQVVWEIAPAQ